MKSIINSILLCLSMVVMSGCNTTEPPIETSGSISLALEDVSCTEFWIRIKSENLKIPYQIELVKKNEPSEDMLVFSNDTILYYSRYLPDTDVRFTANYSTDERKIISSNKLEFKTLDTTNLSYTSSRFHIGVGGYMNSCSILDRNNIWIGGSIQIDSSTTEIFNALHWDGTNWNHLRLYQDYSGMQYVGEIRSIISFASNNIWFTTGGRLSQWDGTTVSKHGDFATGVNMIWGVNERDIYGVGYSGYIFHYNGFRVYTLPLQKNITFTSIYGSSDGKIIYAVGYDTTSSRLNSLVRIVNEKPKVILNDIPRSEIKGIVSGRIEDIWLKNENSIYLLTQFGVYIIDKEGKMKSYHKFENAYRNKFLKIAGVNHNKIVVVGRDNLIATFNGRSWNYDNSFIVPGILYQDLDYKNSVSVMCGLGSINLLDVN